MTGAVTVVVPTRDRPDQLRGCLQALAAALRPGDEVVVVDSASTDAAAVALVAEEAGARLVRVDLPGASRARNAGWRQARHPVVLFTDDDCRPEPGWVDAFARHLGSSADTVAWGPAVVAVRGTGTTDLGVDGPDRAVHGDDVGPLGASCNLAVRREALVAVGGFDELLGAGVPLRAAEDKDLLLRLLADGGSGSLVRDAVVEHVVWRGRAAALRLNHHYGIGQGALGRKVAAMGLDPVASFPDGRVRTPLAQGVQAARDGYRTGVLLSLARAAGVVRGRLAARRLSVREGHLHA